MSKAVAGEAALLTHAHHPKLGFWRTYVFSLDYKMGHQLVQDRAKIRIRTGGDKT